MQELEKLFSHSKDTVVITDCDFNILWSNRDMSIFREYGVCCAELFSGTETPLESGRYELRHGGLIIECNIISYPEKGVYVIMTEEEDILMSFLKKDMIHKFLENQSGAMRSAFAGMVASNTEIKKMFTASKNCSGIQYTNRNIVNSCKIMRYNTMMTELMRYSDGSTTTGRVDLAAVLDVFIENSEDAFEDLFGSAVNNMIHFERDYQPGLYILTDLKRLESCLLSLTLLTNGGKKENNIIRISAVNTGDSISLTFTPDSCGVDEGGGIYSRHLDMYDSDEYKADMMIVRAFCKYFGCTLFTGGSSDESRSFSIRIPVCGSDVPLIEIKSEHEPYPAPLYGKYHFFYSNII